MIRCLLIVCCWTALAGAATAQFFFTPSSAPASPDWYVQYESPNCLPSDSTAADDSANVSCPETTFTPIPQGSGYALVGNGVNLAYYDYQDRFSCTSSCTIRFWMYVDTDTVDADKYAIMSVTSTGGSNEWSIKSAPSGTDGEYRMKCAPSEGGGNSSVFTLPAGTGAWEEYDLTFDVSDGSGSLSIVGGATLASCAGGGSTSAVGLAPLGFAGVFAFDDIRFYDGSAP